MITTPVTHKPRTDLKLGQLVWVRSLNTHRAGLGKILQQYDSNEDLPMVSIRMKSSYYSGWDTPDGSPLIGEVNDILEVASFRIEPIRKDKL